MKKNKETHIGIQIGADGATVEILETVNNHLQGFIEKSTVNNDFLIRCLDVYESAIDKISERPIYNTVSNNCIYTKSEKEIAEGGQ